MDKQAEAVKGPGRPKKADQYPDGRYHCSQCGEPGYVRNTTISLEHMKCSQCDHKWQVFIPPDERKERKRKRRH